MHVTCTNPLKMGSSLSPSSALLWLVSFAGREMKRSKLGIDWKPRRWAKHPLPHRIRHASQPASQREAKKPLSSIRGNGGDHSYSSSSSLISKERLIESRRGKRDSHNRCSIQKGFADYYAHRRAMQREEDSPQTSPRLLSPFPSARERMM